MGGERYFLSCPVYRLGHPFSGPIQLVYWRGVGIGSNGSGVPAGKDGLNESRRWTKQN